MRIYQNYHRHSTYTNPKISDSIATNESYAIRAKELGHGIISTMEHGYQGRYIEGYNLAKQYGLKFLFGVEAYWVKDRTEKDGSNCHIYLGAKNENGRQAINDIISEANITGFYRQARVDIPLLLSLPKDDVWVTTACVAYWNKYEDIDEITKTLYSHFGDNFFLEVQYHDTDKQKDLNRHILELRQKLGCKIIMGCDSHYIDERGDQARTDYINSKGIHYDDEEGWFLDYPDGDIAYERFSRQGILSEEEINEAMNNTNVFLEVEEYDSPIFNTDIKLPTLYPEWTQEQKDEEYKRLVWQGWEDYKKDVPEEEWSKYEKEIQPEIDTVIETKMADYFIDDHYIIKKGIENGGVLTTSGRGSAVSFFTNKLLGFTEVDRISAKVKMYPDRFMSATRIIQSGSLPDIDINVANQEPFAQAQKDVLGDDHAYPMLSYNTLKTSAAWKLYAKAQDIPFTISNAVSGQIRKYELAVKHAEEGTEDDIKVDDYINSEFSEVFEKSKDYRGVISSWSIAPCSYLLYSGSIRKEIGLVKIKDHLCCLMDGHWAEENHFLKNDLLKVSTVDLTSRIFDELNIPRMKVPELLKILEDETDPTWDIYKKGCTLAINQVEQTGTSARVKTYAPKNVSELCAFVAAIRPGFKSMYKTFESREPFEYGIKAFDDLIKTEEMPNSFVLYQEMEMAALNFAGIPMSECYTAIKNIAKKRVDKVLAYKEKFITGFSQAIQEQEHRSKEDADELANKLWQIIDDSSQYSFNASHSYCVAIDSLYGAYLKSHYPLEFYKNALVVYEEKGDKDKMNALKHEAENYFKIKFTPLKFREDNRGFEIRRKTNTITTSISTVKGFSKSIGDKLYGLRNREYDSVIDLYKALDAVGVKSSKLIPLIKIGYFSDFGTIPQLLCILNLFDFFKQGSAKSISKDTLADKDELIPLLEKYGTDKGVKGELKKYNITDMDGLLAEVEKKCKENEKDLSLRDQAQNQIEILGYINLVTYKDEDRKKLFVLDVYSLPDRFKGGIWKYRVKTQSVGTGKLGEISINPKLFEKQPVEKGDVIINPEVSQDRKGYWQFDSYDIRKI